MKFLVDESLSPGLCAFLQTLTTSARHFHAFDGVGREDFDLLQLAIDNDYVVVTADDLGGIVRRNGMPRPSVVEIRELLGMYVGYQGRTVMARFDEVRDALEEGAVVTYTLHDVHVEPLPA